MSCRLSARIHGFREDECQVYGVQVTDLLTEM